MANRPSSNPTSSLTDCLSFENNDIAITVPARFGGHFIVIAKPKVPVLSFIGHTPDPMERETRF